MTDTTYNGWTNRATWLVNLWISNEEWSDTEAREVVRDAFASGDPVVDAADALEDWTNENMLGAATTGLATDLLGCALADVNWREIATHMMED